MVIFKEANGQYIKRQLLISLAIFGFLLVSTTAIVLYGRGYRIGFDKGRPDVAKTGLLHVTSLPDGAQVFINNHLTTATDNTVSLAPGEYQVKIQKEGFFSWEKTLRIEEEVVTKAEALLFPTTPKLENITTSGAQGPVLDPSRTKIAYRVASQSARRNGIFVYDMNANTVLSLQGAIKQVSDDTIALLSTATLSWSPDGQEILASISGQFETPTYYLLNARDFNAEPQDVTLTVDSIKLTWQREKNEKERSRANGLKSKLRRFLAENAHIESWSADEKKFLYVASNSAEMPIIITPRLLGINNLKEDRSVKKNNLYIYDTVEDVNIKILDSVSEACQQYLEACELPTSWHPGGSNLIHVSDGKINMMDYDGTNATTVYAGPFLDNYVFPWPNGSKVVILTNFNNQTVAPNLYTISLR